MNHKILVIRFGSLGDVILTSPTVLNLKIGYPRAHITYLTKERFAPVVKMFGTVDDIVTLPNSCGFFAFLSLIRKLEQINFDIIIDLHSNFRSSLAKALLTTGQKVVYPRDRSERQRTVRFKDFQSPENHTIDKYNDCLKQLGLGAPSRRTVFQNVVDSNRSEQPQVLIAPGAAFANKQWPIEKFREVAFELYKTHSAKIIWAVTDNHDIPASLTESIPEDSLSLLNNHPIENLAKIISGALVTIANDSGIAHLSSAVGTPVISIFGPTHSALGFRPRGMLDYVMEADVFCRPCSLHGDKKCYREERFCFTQIEPEQVATKAAEIINDRTKESKALFVDRDGTVIVDKPFDSNPDNIDFEAGSIEALKKAQEMGFKIIIVTNQSGIARGYFGLEAMLNFNRVLGQRLSAEGIQVDSIEYCPHYPTGSVPEYTRSCNCRKPAAGMAEKAARNYNIDLRRSYVIGDKLDDVNLGRIIGAKSFLVLTGQGQKNLKKLGSEGGAAPNMVCDNLLVAVEVIGAREGAAVSKPG